MKYSRKKSRITSNEPCKISDSVYELENMKEACRVDFANQVMRIWGLGAMYAEDRVVLKMPSINWGGGSRT